MNLPKLESVDILGKRVLVRADVDLGEEIREGDEVKLSTIIPTLKYLVEGGCKVIIIGHRGRPEAKKNENLSLRKVYELLSFLLRNKVKFVDEIISDKVYREVKRLRDSEILMLENLRFDPREEANDEGFAKELATLGEIYVNEAFSASHREHASIVALPLQFKSKNLALAGFRFAQEVEKLSQVFEKPARPLIFIISGIKKDKLEMIGNIKKFADKVLVAGRLPEFLLGLNKSSVSNKVSHNPPDYKEESKVIIAQLNPDKEDITDHSIKIFEAEIAKAKTIVLAGVIGKYEDEGHREGTKRVFEAVANSNAYKIAGGGDTEAALAMFNLTERFDWISVGGGAMLEFLAKGTLPGIQALVS